MTVSSTHNAPSLLSSQNGPGPGAWLTSEDCNPFLRGDKTHCPCVTEKTDPRLSCVNHNSSLIPSYKTWTHNSQTDLGLGLRPPVGNLFPSVIRIGAVIVTGRCLTKWNHTFIYFLRTWFNVTFDTFLLSWAGMNIERLNTNYGWWILLISNCWFWRFSGNRNSWFRNCQIEENYTLVVT